MTKTKTTPLTLDDLERALQDERHLGFGYSTSSHLPRRKGLALDEAVVAIANELGLDYDALFHWTNSKHGRWLVDSESTTKTNARRFLNADTVKDARP